MKMMPDELDLLLISELREDCRMTYKDIAKKTDSNINTIASRIKRLEREGYIIGYSAHIDYERIGYRTAAFLRVMLNDAKSLTQSALSDIVSMPEVMVAYRMTGNYDVNLAMRARDFDTLLHRISEIGSDRNVIKLKSEFIVKEYMSLEDFNPFGKRLAQPNQFKERKKRIDGLDLAILRELRSNANRPLIELSKIVRAPISTVKERSDRMAREGIIRKFVALVDFRKLGYTAFSGISIKLDSDRMNDPSIISSILNIPDVGTLYRILGSYDLFAGVITKNTDGSFEALKRISSIPGVKRTEQQISLSVLKSRSQFNPLSGHVKAKEKIGDNA